MARKKTIVTETIEGDEHDLTRAGGPGSGSWDGPGQPRFAAGSAGKADQLGQKAHDLTNKAAPNKIYIGGDSGTKEEHQAAHDAHLEAANAHEEASKGFAEKGQSNKADWHSSLATAHRSYAVAHSGAMQSLATGGSGLKWTTSGSGDAYIVHKEGHDPQVSMVGSYKSSKAAEEHIRTGKSQPGNELATGGSGGAHKATDTDAAQLCRALNSSASFDGNADARFMWMPAGKAKELHLTYDDKPATVYVDVMPGDEKTVMASFNALCEKAAPQKPFGDIEHRRSEASFWPQGFDWASQGERDGIYVRAEWSGLGKKHVTEKIHRSFSPSFKTDAVWSWDKDNQRYFCAAGERGSKENPARITGVGFDVGTLTNQPAFKDMQPLFAKENHGAAQPNGREAAQEITMIEQELAALKAENQRALDAANLRAKNAEEIITKQGEEAIDAAIVRAVGRNAIDPKDEAIKASYKSLGATNSKSVVAIVDALPAKQTPGTTRAGLGTVEVSANGFEETYRGWANNQAPISGLMRAGKVQEAVKLSRASASIYQEMSGMIAKGANVVTKDMLTRAADVTTNVDSTFGTLSGLLLVLQHGLGFLKNNLIGASDITTDFRNEPASYNQWVRSRYFTVPTVYDYTAPTYVGTAPSTTETAKSAAGVVDVDVIINKNKRVWVPISSDILGGSVRNLFQEQKMPAMYAVAEQMNSDLIANVLSGNLNAGGTTITFSTGAATLSISDAKDVQTWVPAVGLKADVAKMPSFGRFMFLHSAYKWAMDSDKNYAQLDAISKASRAQNPLAGELPPPFGFEFHSSQLMRDNADYTAATTLGFCGVKESLILVGRVPQDYTNAIEAPPGATIQILTEPETGLSIMVTQFVDNRLETANLRVAIMYGTGIGLKTAGFLINPK